MSSPDPSQTGSGTRRDPSSTRLAGEPKPAPAGGQAAPAPLAAGLYIVSTPIGNLRDITLRALDTLAGAEEVLAEDTRHARRLLEAHGIAAKLTPYHDHNAARRRPELLARLQDGAALALISDAGTPLISDPGFKLVREAAEAGVRIVPVPGPSALLAGLVTSGLPTDRFLFAGFLPAKSAARRRALEALQAVPTTLVFYETGRRLAGTLADCADLLGAARPAAVARELTKLFEETRRGDLGSLARQYAETGPPKGEIVLLIGPPEAEGTDAAALDAALRAALADMPTKAAADAVARRFDLPRREVYQRALAIKSEEPGHG